MKLAGRVQSLWRYPVKSMRGEELQQAFAGFGGIYGDRLYAFASSAQPSDFPYFTARQKELMLLYKPTYRHEERMSRPPSLAEAADLMLDVQTVSGETFAIDDPLLAGSLKEGVRDRHELTLLRSDRAMADCHPISLFSVQTARQLSQEIGVDIDPRSFRANIYLDLESGLGFGEDELVGHTLQIGPDAKIAIVERDPRCKMITLDPDTAKANPQVMRTVARSHEGKAGVYGAVLTEGSISRGDAILLLE